MSASPLIPADRIVVIMPNWLGDAVMATPFLRALRSLYPTAHIAALTRPLVAPVLAGLPFVDETQMLNKGESKVAVRWLRSQKFDLGILLPNSFRSAWLLWRGRVKHRLGYAREFRSCLLTHSLPPIRKSGPERRQDRAKRDAILSVRHTWPAHGPTAAYPVPPRQPPAEYHLPTISGYQPVPTIDYYLKLAECLGAPPNADRHMQLAVTAEERAQADSVLAQIENQKSKIENLITLVPGANFGASKCWLPERFAEVSDRLIEERSANILLASAPAEMPIVDAILAASRHRDRISALAKLNNGQGIGLGALKEIVRRSRLMLCNDTGPRHFAAAFDIPTVTLFGPTDPVWAETYSRNERIVRIDVPCGPCQLKKCPIDHRCMTGLTVEMVMNAINELWPAPAPTNFTN